MSGRRAVLLLLALGGAAAIAAASTPDEIEARRLEYRLSDLERRISDQRVTQVVARQKVLDAGPEISRKVCEQYALQIRSPDTFKFLHGAVKDLDSKKSAKLLDDGQKDRLAAVKQKLKVLEQDSSMNCKALAPINP